MLLPYHISITNQALSRHFSPRALERIIRANLKQDDLLTGQIGHDEYHFDNKIAESDHYIEEQRVLAVSAVKKDDPPTAWSAFGRLLHTTQDFYAHSNYVDLWLSRFTANHHAPPPPSEIDPVMDDLIRSPDLRTGKVYYFWEALSLIPGIRRFALSRAPADSHVCMNIDSPACGERFDYAFEAAVKRTRYELDKTMSALPSGQEARFQDL